MPLKHLVRDRPADHPHVEVVTVDRPPVNALVDATYREIEEVFATVADDRDVRCVVLTGAGERAFIAGADVNEFADLGPQNGPAYTLVRRRAFRALHECTVPVVGAINGPALGAGLVIASVCDFLVASERATFGLPEIDVGVLGGAKHLSRLVPPHRLRRMMLTAERLSARELHALGGVTEVVEPEELMPAALGVADTIAAKSPTAARLAKDAMNLIEPIPLDDAYHVEQLYTMILSSSPDSKEAAAAFLERRAPRFDS